MSSIVELSQQVSPPPWEDRCALPHVLLVLDQFPAVMGGGERAVLKLAELLPRYGYRASILTFSAHPESAAVRSAPCPLYLLPIERTYDLTALRAALDLGAFLREQRVQIVQTFFESSDLWAGLVTKTLSDCKLVWSRRDMGILRGRKHRVAYRLMAGVPDAVFAVSEEVRLHSIAVDGTDAARVQTIYNGLNLSEWSTFPSPARTSGDLHVTTVGNIRRVKGHDIFIRAAACIAQQCPEATFSIAGAVLEPDYYAELEGLARVLGLTGRLRFCGGVADLRAHLSAADIFVLPSRSEGFSNAILEAMAASLPVVATDAGGNPEAVKDGVSGILVPTDDPAALAAAVVRLLRDPSMAKAMGASGRAIAAEDFSDEAMMRGIARAYAGLLGER